MFVKEDEFPSGSGLFVGFGKEVIGQSILFLETKKRRRVQRVISEVLLAASNCAEESEPCSRVLCKSARRHWRRRRRGLLSTRYRSESPCLTLESSALLDALKVALQRWWKNKRMPSHTCHLFSSRKQQPTETTTCMMIKRLPIALSRCQNPPRIIRLLICNL